jgi:hypothetical protein
VNERPDFVQRRAARCDECRHFTAALRNTFEIRSSYPLGVHLRFQCHRAGDRVLTYRRARACDRFEEKLVHGGEV